MMHDGGAAFFFFFFWIKGVRHYNRCQEPDRELERSYLFFPSTMNSRWMAVVARLLRKFMTSHPLHEVVGSNVQTPIVHTFCTRTQTNSHTKIVHAIQS
jgi:hypothetical protein